ncbi:MAG TPA: SIS domain-containing protein [Gemmatimonadaceae bacterium]|nr:SIS domain-containing protein [Gemmatimonadaceae bacterium]
MSSGSTGTTGNTFADHFASHQQVVRQSVVELHDVATAVERVLIDALQKGNKILSFGNGGSATQASHLAGELIGRFLKNRRPLPAIALVSDPGSVTCIANDFGYAALFERQVEGLARPGDVAIGLTTSGRSENVKRGLDAARRAGAIAVALTGAAGLIEGKADYVVAVPSAETASIQEVHLMLLHAWCQGIDKVFA